MEGHHHDGHVGSIGHARTGSNGCTIVTSKAQSGHAQTHTWMSVGCVGEWRRGEDRGVCAGVASHSPDFDTSYIVWLYAVGGTQVHTLTPPALHEV